MNTMTFRTINRGIAAIFVALVTTSRFAAAQETPIYPDANKIEGTWDANVTYRNCATGAVLFAGQSLVSYAQGGVMMDITSGAAPSGRSPGLGVWEHIGGRSYRSTFKQFRYNPDGTFAGKIIVAVQITHEHDDTLTTSAVGRFFNASGTQTSAICPTGVQTRFTGEQ